MGLNLQENDPGRYNRPTADEVAIIIVRPEDDNEPFERDIIIQDCASVDCKTFLNILQVTYMLLRYPFLFPRGEEGWHMRIPLTGVDLANNVNLQACRHMHIEEGGGESDPDGDASHHG